MLISKDELMYLQSQLEGLESIFLELMPFGVELKRHEVQQYYEKRFEHATKPVASVAEGELRRQFNTKANQVRNLVDSAESLGDVSNHLNLIRAAATLPEERAKPLKAGVDEFCQKLLNEGSVDSELFDSILKSSDLGHVEARVLIGSCMFIVQPELDKNGKPIKVYDLLEQMMQRISSTAVLETNDPFFVEAAYALEAMKEEEA